MIPLTLQNNIQVIVPLAVGTIVVIMTKLLGQGSREIICVEVKISQASQ
jgi:hypothetical protein